MSEISAAAEAAIDAAVDQGLLPDDPMIIGVWEKMARQGLPVVYSLEMMAAGKGVLLAASAPYREHYGGDGDGDGEEESVLASVLPPQTPRERRRRRTQIEAAAEVRRDHATEEDDWAAMYPPSERFRP